MPKLPEPPPDLPLAGEEAEEEEGEEGEEVKVEGKELRATWLELLLGLVRVFLELVPVLGPALLALRSLSFWLSRVLSFSRAVGSA